MNWENKTKMCQHLNNSEYTEATNLFLESIEIIDDQAIDMFISGIELTKECLSKDIDNHKIIAEKIKDRQSESFRTAMRMALYEELTIYGCNK
jgi:DNA-binding GntR family transcriptional regulator